MRILHMIELALVVGGFYLIAHNVIPQTVQLSRDLAPLASALK